MPIVRPRAGDGDRIGVRVGHRRRHSTSWLAGVGLGRSPGDGGDGGRSVGRTHTRSDTVGAGAVGHVRAISAVGRAVGAGGVGARLA